MYVTCISNSAGYKFSEAKILNVEGLGNGGKHGFVSTSSDHRIYVVLQEVGSG